MGDRTRPGRKERARAAQRLEVQTVQTLKYYEKSIGYTHKLTKNCGARGAGEQI